MKRAYKEADMGVLRIYTYPDEVLLKRSDPLENIDGEVARLAEDMANTMYLAPGAGLAANQVGRPVRLVVLDVTDRQDEAPRGLITLVNPVIEEAEGEIVFEEGCLSVPDYCANVKRAARVLVRGYDLSEKEVELDAEGYLAVVLQHEIDHLEGKLFIDRISRLKRELYKRKLKKRLVKED